MVFVKHNSLKSDIFFNPIFIPGFSGSRFFRLQVFQGPASGSRVRVQVLEVASLKSLNNYFFRWIAYKSLFSRFSVLSYNMWSSNHFPISSCFPCFSGSRFFRVRVQVLEVAKIVCINLI